MVAAIIIAVLIVVVANYLTMILACSVVLKQYTKKLAQIIDICASEDKDKQFIREWAKFHR